MKTVHAIAELRAQLHEWRRAGQRIALVPTMGNLHRGHLELVRRGREVADRVVASVFVNPLQFGPNEDFNRYPRTLPADQAGLERAQADLLFAPSAAEIYPRGMERLTRVNVPAVSDILCGHFRPGHFEGVATVVSILFNLVQPDAALFGEKDYQQLYIIRRMVADLHMPIDVVGVATEREPDGLALSSRNQYLDAQERKLAPELYATLTEVADKLKAGRRDFSALSYAGIKRLEATGFRPQYLEVLNADLVAPAKENNSFVVLVAAYLGRTRLIDNVSVTAL
ncbi:MAG TPA: pantoate--beta-alanine ligase [Nevskiaceae bacterium]|nr:pantoate--beta-alanine ligase [Nevskiaceae bacterium]